MQILKNAWERINEFRKKLEEQTVESEGKLKAALDAAKKQHEAGEKSTEGILCFLSFVRASSSFLSLSWIS